VARVVLLVDAADGEVNLGDGVVFELAKLDVTSVSLLRDRATVGIGLEGWLFDPARSADAAVSVLAADRAARSLHPVMHMAVEPTR
jgi:hypothetical protein